MKTQATVRRSGLILLVVLGMLTLFSMLTITYLAYSGSSRAGSMQLARREYRGTPSPRLTDEALKQLLRGTPDVRSALYGHSLLEDLYSPPFAFRVRDYALLFQQTNGITLPLTPDDTKPPPGGIQRPMVLGGRFLRIPLVLETPRFLPEYSNSLKYRWVSSNLSLVHDIVAGRIVTFAEGPLAGESFRIIRYIGPVSIDPNNPTSQDLIDFAQQYSIIIDLNEADMDKVVSYAGGEFTINGWINRSPAGSYLCHASVSATTGLTSGHTLLVNGAALNGHGLGVGFDGTQQVHELKAQHTSRFGRRKILQSGNFTPYIFSNNPPPQPLDKLAVPLQPRLGDLGLIPLAGSANESYDAADYNDFYLALRASGASIPAAIIPSFHRAALINYVAHWKPSFDYSTLEELLWTLERIQLAAGRPLSINVIVQGVEIYTVNPNFTGSNSGDYVSGSQKVPQLNLDLGSNFSNSWPGAKGQFLNWIRWLVAGPWDVDNDADGLADSVWVDLNLPLMTSPEGKLLKMMAAYYVEDLDGKLDLNAAGNISQSLDAGYTNEKSSQFADYFVRIGELNVPNLNLPQGFGSGPAEISLRHLFADSASYRTFLDARYRGPGNASTEEPGSEYVDAISQLIPREEYPLPRIAPFVVLQRTELPALPSSRYGVMALGLDRLGNPLMMNKVSPFDIRNNNPYEARWQKPSFFDSPYSLDDWERLIRTNDWDRSAFEDRLTSRFPIGHRHVVTPKSAHLRIPVLAGRSLQADTAINSFYDLVNSMLNRRSIPGISAEGFRELFPLEFHRSERLNLNRPLGNGTDDNNNGEVDEPSEVVMGQFPLKHLDKSSLTYRTVPTGRPASDIVEDYVFGQSNFEFVDLKNVERNIWGGLESRQLLARHLYCLAQLIIPPNYKFPNLPSSSNPPPPAERARILAQWAANVVDFRDADSAMMRFPYDAEPFTLKTNVGKPPQNWLPDDGVVWGMEQPELLLTESLATHDIRAKEDASSQAPKPFYQYRVPQGSLFLELYCPRTPSGPNNVAPDIAPDIHVPGVSGSLYDRVTGKLNLGAQSPPYPNYAQFPVWRIYVGESQPEIDPNKADPDRPNVAFNKSHDDQANTTLNPLNYTFQFPSDDGLKNSNTAKIPQNYGFKFDYSEKLKDPDPEKSRLIIFRSGFLPTYANCPGVKPKAPATPQDSPADDRVFVNQGSDIQLGGGQYLVIGPRETTYFGSRKQVAITPKHQPNPHRIELISNIPNYLAPQIPMNVLPNTNQMFKQWANIYNYTAEKTRFENAVAKRPTMADCEVMIAAAALPNHWANANPPPAYPYPTVGINVSEPLPTDADYYKAPQKQLNASDVAADPSTNAKGFGLLPPDGYLGQNKLFDRKSKDTPLENWGTPGELNGDVPLEQFTQEDFCTAYLQRLADPNKPWHEKFNPYITVDWIPIDLTVFNGEDAPNSSTKKFRFASRQKTGVAINASKLEIDLTSVNPPLDLTGGNPAMKKTFYSYHTPEELPETPVDTNASDVYFNRTLSVDDPIKYPTQNRSHVDYVVGKKSFCTLGFLNSTYELESVWASGFQGAPEYVPQTPIWLNRPFVNPLELTWVPLSAPGQFMQEFTADVPVDTQGVSVDTYGESTHGFAHLLNFFGHPKAINNQSPDNYPASTLFELVETPSPWSDTDEFIPPDDVKVVKPTTVPMTTEDWATNSAMSLYRAPYNRIPGFVEPGRVNINTLTEPNVFRGLMWNFMTPNAIRNDLINVPVPAFWDKFTLSRQGYVAAGGDNPYLNPNFPTQFSGIFKSTFEASIVPVPNLELAARYNPTHVTLLRGNPDQTIVANTSVLPTTPLLFQPTVPYQPALPAQGAVPLQPALPPQLPHAFKQYLPFTRLANLVTQRSNVFAVRITIGYFEFDSSTGIGVEYGAEQGKARRHRSFYVIDRSQTVGFQVGQDLNTDKCVLLRRVIE